MGQLLMCMVQLIYDWLFFVNANDFHDFFFENIWWLSLLYVTYVGQGHEQGPNFKSSLHCFPKTLTHGTRPDEQRIVSWEGSYLTRHGTSVSAYGSPWTPLKSILARVRPTMKYNRTWLYPHATVSLLRPSGASRDTLVIFHNFSA